MIRIFLLLGLVLSCNVVPAFAAEVLHVQGGPLLQVGDRNRTYTIELACVEIVPEQESEALEWLRQRLPRRRRVNLQPIGSSNGQLLARVTPIGEEKSLSTGLIDAGLATDSCLAEPG
ncbi:nuclease [Synechococcus sp. M16CYN]